MTDAGPASVLVEFTLPGRPQAWQRVRRASGGRAFVPPATGAAERALGWIAVRAMGAGGHLEPLAGPLRLTVWFHFQVNGRHVPGLVHYQAPDCDNLLKTVMDGLTDVVWRDDRQVAEAHAYKLWASSPATIVRVEALT